MDFSKLNLKDHQPLAREIILQSVKEKFRNRNEFQKFRNKVIKSEKGVIFDNLYLIKAYQDLLKEGAIKENPDFFKLIQKRSVRTLSGVAPLTVLTKPYPCPGRCIYCPTDVRMPKSYLTSQPAAQRGFRQRFNPYTQVFVRLNAFYLTGHEISKVELRILGGSFNAYPKKYQTWFIKRCLQALNEFPQQTKKWKGKYNIKKNSLVNPYGGMDELNTVNVESICKSPVKFEKVVSINETAKVKCIGINIETRPDLINKKEVRRFRNLGITKVEMGVQTLDDKVQKVTMRGHTTNDVIEATKLLKDAGMKIGYHMMPNLPGATVKEDKKMIAEIFENENFKPDYLKIYPCVVVPKSKLALIYKRGDYKPYNDKILEEVLLENLKSVPEWCRIDRVARDIPSNEIVSGFRMSNIRQILEQRLKKEGTPCKDIRSREIRDEEVDIKNIELVIRDYRASGGLESFISYEDIKKNKLIALIRLRLPGKAFIKEIKNSAIIREVHVYGIQLAVGKKGSDKQHIGWGTKLLKQAENLALENGYKKIAVIAGIGTREYYAKKGYRLEGTYMVKKLK